MSSFYSKEELAGLGLKAYGENVMISRKASIYGAENIVLGSHVRIDDFCVLSGKITIGSYVHIGAGTMFFAGDAGISFGSYSGISSRCGIFAISDDFSGDYMISPMVPKDYCHVIGKAVDIGEHCMIATGCTILPGVTLGEGTGLGAMTLVTADTEPWCMYTGVPAVKIKQRRKGVLDMRRRFEESCAQGE